MYRILTVVLLAAAALFAACVQAPTDTANTAQNTAKDPNRKIKIGFAMDTVKEERWQRDRDAFEAHCKKMNVECVVTVANNVAERQASDVENLLTQGVDVLVIAPPYIVEKQHIAQLVNTLADSIRKHA